jgi:predicted amidohydrolase
MRLAAVAAHFGRDLDLALQRIESIIGAARRAGAALLVLPDGTLGGHHHRPGTTELPVALDLCDPIFERIAALAGDLVVCLGFCERAYRHDRDRYNAAVCLSGEGIHGRHRKVHLAAGEAGVYLPGEGFAAFDTPAGRLGMLIDYDKSFPEAARALGGDGAQVLACLSAWPASTTTGTARRVVKDRQARLFDLYDCARAAENQVGLASANQTGGTGGLRFLGQAKVVGPGGDVRARTWTKAGLAIADIDVPAELARARQVHEYRS